MSIPGSRKSEVGRVDTIPPMNPHAGQPVLTMGPKPKDARLAMILVHGRGASAEDILGLASELGRDDVAYLAPQAAGNTWYPYSFLAPLEKNEPGLTSALGVLGQLVSTLGDQGLPAERVGFLGFSQGACLSLEFAARERAPLCRGDRAEWRTDRPARNAAHVSGRRRRDVRLPRVQRRRSPHPARTGAGDGAGVPRSRGGGRRADLPGDGTHRQPRRDRGGQADSRPAPVVLDRTARDRTGRYRLIYAVAAFPTGVPMSNPIERAYDSAKDRYAEHGVDVESAMRALAGIPISLHCWQGDDVGGFEQLGTGAWRRTGGDRELPGQGPHARRAAVRRRTGVLAHSRPAPFQPARVLRRLRRPPGRSRSRRPRALLRLDRVGAAARHRPGLQSDLLLSSQRGRQLHAVARRSRRSASSGSPTASPAGASARRSARRSGTPASPTSGFPTA